MKNKLSFVNPLQGTNSTREFSRGNTLPLVARPWGMHHWTLQTAAPPWNFHPAHAKLQGVRLTHQPSPWMEDYGSFLVSAYLGSVDASIPQQASAYGIGDAIINPNYLRVELLRYEIAVEMAPTGCGALFRFTFASSEEPRIRLTFDAGHDLSWNGGNAHFRGFSADQHGGIPDSFSLRFFGAFDVIPKAFIRTGDGGSFIFPSGTKALELRISGSFISGEMAFTSFQRELRGQSLPEIREQGAKAWTSLLDRIEIEEADPDQVSTFYSCLYRCLLFPRFLDEITAEGQVVHWSPYDGSVHEGSLCADNGFWDTFRTIYPLLALVYPDKLRTILNGWLNACREAGWSPKWASPGLRDCMIGTHFDAIVADAVSKGITDWNVEEAFFFLWKNATVPSEDGRFGRRGLEDYDRCGYVPSDKVPYSVSRTLDFSYNDFCVAQVAQFLGHGEKEKQMRQRARSYRNVFDPSVGFMRGRLANGEWEPFDEFRWGGSYIEGGPWQHSFNVPHDPLGLASLHGGSDALIRQLDRMLATPPFFKIGTYPEEIHEMTEMALARFGQYAHSNQPVHNYPFLYAILGDREKTSHLVHRVAGELYGPDYLPGDEDNGEMSAWYVFACLGLYPFCPGKAEYVQFDSVISSGRIHLSQGAAWRFGKQHSSLRPDSATNLIAHADLVAQASAS